MGLPWYSSGWDSVLPLQGAWGSIPGQGKIHPACCAAWPKKKKTFQSSGFDLYLPISPLLVKALADSQDRSL